MYRKIWRTTQRMSLKMISEYGPRVSNGFVERSHDQQHTSITWIHNQLIDSIIDISRIPDSLVFYTTFNIISVIDHGKPHIFTYSLGFTRTRQGD